MLEAEWNAKLRALDEAREVAEQQRHQDQAHLSAAEQGRIRELPQSFVRFWKDSSRADRERKRLVRLLIEDVTLRKEEQISAQIRFKGGATRALTIPLPPPFQQSRLTPPDTLVAMDRLLDDYTDAEVAEHLNAQGYRTFAGLPFQATHVSQLRRKHGLKDRFSRLRAVGMLTAEELAARLGVTPQTIWQWYRRGWITGACYNDRGTCLFALPAIVPPGSRRRRNHTPNTP